MHAFQGHHSTTHPANHCECATCKLLPKPDMIASTERNNVISFAAVMKSKHKTKANKIIECKFNYPMLECS
jgi:hypothetical protein